MAHKMRVSIPLPCSGTECLIFVSPDGTVECRGHDEALERSLAALGAPLPQCLQLKDSLTKIYRETWGGPPRPSQVRLMLSLSTAHMTKADDKRLRELFKGNDARVACVEQGWMVWVDSDLEDAWDWVHEERLSDRLLVALELAVALGMNWLYFDPDAPVIAGLPSGTW